MTSPGFAGTLLSVFQTTSNVMAETHSRRLPIEFQHNEMTKVTKMNEVNEMNEMKKISEMDKINELNGINERPNLKIQYQKNQYLLLNGKQKVNKTAKQSIDWITWLHKVKFLHSKVAFRSWLIMIFEMIGGEVIFLLAIIKQLGAMSQHSMNAN